MLYTSAQTPPSVHRQRNSLHAGVPQRPPKRITSDAPRHSTFASSTTSERFELARLVCFRRICVLQAERLEHSSRRQSVLPQIDIRNAEVVECAHKGWMQGEGAVIVADSFVGSTGIGQSRTEAII
jgi:hypothetical protein